MPAPAAAPTTAMTAGNALMRPLPPAPAEGCDCTTGTQSPCDAGLICCGTTGTPGGPGTCQTEAACNPPCTGQGCACNGGVQGNCDAGLGLLSGWTIDPRWRGYLRARGAMRPTALHRPGMRLQWRRAQGNCDTGLVCCQDGVSIPGGAGTCQPEAQCAPPPCTGEGCDCTGGVQGNCDAGLVCCQNGQEVPGGAGTCTANCAPPPCTGEGCACNGGVAGRVRRRPHLLPDGSISAGRTGQLPAGRRLWTAALHRQRRRLAMRPATGAIAAPAAAPGTATRQASATTRRR